ncbi:MAG: zinc-ribbon domain-containing protein [Firmicutes bacterium]|nr:zinc-ribbon domain-containing protein [Bacillota bacterium]
MQCGFCHREVPDDSRFCPFCGHALGLRTLEPPPPPVAAPAAAAVAPPAADASAAPRPSGGPGWGDAGPAGTPAPPGAGGDADPADAGAEEDPAGWLAGRAAGRLPRREWETWRAALTLDRVLFAGALVFAVAGFLWGIARPVTGLEWIAFGLVLMEAARFVRPGGRE